MNHDLAPGRLDEIQGLLRQLAGAPAAGDLAPLLTSCRTALADLLADRDALVKANAAAAEELALWTGSL
ncbi:hypothetical protein ACFRQM_09550 [Streptomyces sp. NPDC056831]|uniref:hypothetical protein n=1 Tax=Streptomyces sp. NPDC056831 TaxID=3345954 RepID=UPI0036908323